VTRQVNENARRPAVLHDIGPMSIKSLDYPELGILRAHEPTGPGSPDTRARSPDPRK
jgi:hypothetical protein